MVTLDKIYAVASRIAEQFHPQRIVLFGSYAYGTPTAASDVDMLVVMPYRGKGAYKSLEICNRIQPDVPLDLIVRTAAQVKRRVAMDDYFMKEIVTKGRVLYEAHRA